MADNRHICCCNGLQIYGFLPIIQTPINKIKKVYKMEQEKVTRQELRDMRIGQTRIFTLTNAKKVTSARVTCNQIKNEEGLEFTVRPDYQAKAVSITRTK
jgi:nucleoside diphosphate kinase